ncbi:MAG: hypothetical protein IME94_10695 [Proteobacteria bacterium]|nr:hypothetical protein [Pseudomonadota bacterium]
MKRYKITDKDALPAHRWIQNQITKQGGYFPVNSIDTMGDNSQAHDTFSKLKPNDADTINAWSEKHLDKAQWKKLKNSIRAYRLKLKREDDLTLDVKRIAIKVPVYGRLKALADKRNEGLSETVEHLLSYDR